MLEFFSIFVKITEGLLVGLKRRRKPAHLSCCAKREHESDRSAAVCFDPRHPPCSCNSIFTMMPRDRELDYSRRPVFAFRRCERRQRCSKRDVGNFLGLTQLAEARQFFRTSMACRSASANARAPSSAANRLRFERAMPSGDGSADFLAIIFNPH